GVSPLLMERYISAAETISALAVGDVTQPRSAVLYRVRNDLPQGEHVDGLPEGTRGGTSVQHNFPLDGEYVIKVRLWRERAPVPAGAWCDEQPTSSARRDP